MKQFICIFICYLSAVSLLAQTNDSYIRKGSLGKRVIQQEDTISQNAFTFRPISKWVGERFIFLPKTKKLQDYGYQNFDVSYDKYVGRISKVISIDESGSFPIVTFKMEDNGKEMRSDALLNDIEGIAPISDIDSARSRWLNKTLWFKKSELVLYDEEKDKFSGINFKKYSPVKVIDIIAGWYNTAPVRFIIQSTEGNEGFVDINLSGTNVSEKLRVHSRFEDNFFIQDPRIIYSWPEEVWKVIQEGKVIIGMTSEQTELSWGKPKDINRTKTANGNSEQWIYQAGNYLYFEDGILKTIQN